MNTGYFYHHDYHDSCLETKEYKRGPSLQVLVDWKNGGTLKDIVKSGEKTDLWEKNISEFIFVGE